MFLYWRNIFFLDIIRTVSEMKSLMVANSNKYRAISQELV